MMRSLWTAASGMTGQQFNIDTISNNLSNVNTTGFKQNRAEFEDLLYQTGRLAGTPATEETVIPHGYPGGTRGQGRRHPADLYPGEPPADWGSE
jgi:flagellar basal-body rod protein FlgG